MAPGASGKRRGWCCSGGTGNVECTIPVIDDGKRIGKRGAAGVYNAPLQRMALLDIKRRSKFFEKISTFLSPGCRSTRNQALLWYSGRRDEAVWAKDFERKAISSCKKKYKILPLPEKDADVIRTGHPDRRLFDLINLIFVPLLSRHHWGQTERSVVRN